MSARFASSFLEERISAADKRLVRRHVHELDRGGPDHGELAADA
jgi:hypothetical protein